MNVRRLRPADWLTGAAGLALLALLFAPWYGGGGGGTLSGWRSFALTDLWLALTAVLAIAVPVVTAARDAPAIPIAADVLCATVALVALLLVLLRLIDIPQDAVVSEREWGVFAGALAVLGVFAGSVWGMRDESAPALRRPPPIPTMPAPPAAAPGHEPTATET